MATSSLLDTIVIKDKRAIQKMALAMEAAESSKKLYTPVVKANYPTEEEIRKMFLKVNVKND